MTLSAQPVEILHASEAPQLRVSVTAEADTHGLCTLAFSGTMCTTTVPGALQAITRWLRRADPERIAVDLAEIEFIDGRGVSLLVDLQIRAEALGIAWSITDAGVRARIVLEVCNLLESMSVEPVAN